MNQERRLIGMFNAEAHDGGTAVGFRVKTAGGELDVQCTLAELGDIFSFLGHLARAASDHRAAEYLTTVSPNAYLAPVPAKGMGFQAGSSPNETLLVMRLWGFDMAFSVPNDGLAEVADGLARTARTLSADPSRRQ